MFALIDCNNFFVSCERAFQPELKDVPVAVLSSNDGCVISRSNEAKEIGVPMGAPFFQFKDFFEEKGVRIFSSNFALYSDMSRRVMSVLEEFSDDVEVYSVDEAFLRVPKNIDASAWGACIHAAILKGVGIPVSVGIARTKTLAKVAGHVAKEAGKRGGSSVFDYEASPDKEAILASLTAGEVWGIGGNTARELLRSGIKTALDFANAPDRWIKANFGVGGMKKALELRGIPAFGPQSSDDSKKSIRSTRSFGRGIYELSQLERSIAVHVHRAAARMREQGSAAAFASIFIGTGKHSKEGRWYGSCTIGFEFPTADECEIITRAKEAVRSVFRPGFKYARSGIALGGFVPIESVPAATLFGETGFRKRWEVMSLMDGVNTRYGEGSLIPAAALPEAGVAARHQFVSPAHTTRWEELLRASA